MKTSIGAMAAGAAIALLVSSGARADTPSVAAVKSTIPLAEEAKPSAAAPGPFGKAKLVSDSSLERIAGREDVSQVVIARNTGTVANNTIGDHSTTGTITFDGQAFEGLRGLSVLSANTGNNVSINASMNVNVAIHQ